MTLAIFDFQTDENQLSVYKSCLEVFDMGIKSNMQTKESVFVCARESETHVQNDRTG